MSPEDDLEVDPAVDADEPTADESVDPAALPIDLDEEANPADLYEQELPVGDGAEEDGPYTV
jgi:hypothetical protein